MPTPAAPSPTAIFGDPTKVKYVSLAPAQRLVALQSGEVDLPYAQPHLDHDARDQVGHPVRGRELLRRLGLSGAQGLRRHVDLEAERRQRLHDRRCRRIELAPNTSRKIKVRYKAVPFAEGEQMRKAFLAKRCDAMFHDVSAHRQLQVDPRRAVRRLRPPVRTYGREPLAGAVRKGDDRWFDIVRYTYNAMVAAEELGITSKNVKSFASSTDPAVKRLLGHRRRPRSFDGPGQGLGRQRDLAGRQLRRNVGACFLGERHAARCEPARRHGGLLYAFPMQ